MRDGGRPIRRRSKWREDTLYFADDRDFRAVTLADGLTRVVANAGFEGERPFAVEDRDARLLGVSSEHRSLFLPDGTRVYHLHFAPPALLGGRVARSLLTGSAKGVALDAGLAAFDEDLPGLRGGADDVPALFPSFTKRDRASMLIRRQACWLTDWADWMGVKRPALVKIDKDRGGIESHVDVGEADAQFRVDAVRGGVFHVHGGNTVVGPPF